jgi:hypothetical protein
LNNRPQVVSRINRAMYDFFVDCWPHFEFSLTLRSPAESTPV